MNQIFDVSGAFFFRSHPKDIHSLLIRGQGQVQLDLQFFFHDCIFLHRHSVSNHDMPLKWKNAIKGTLSESQQQRMAAHIRGNQFAEYWMEKRERFNGSTGRLVTARLNKPRRQDCSSRKNGLMQESLIDAKGGE